MARQTAATMTACSDHDLMMESLDIVGARGCDIVPPFFHRFLTAHPEEEERFFNPATSHGTMTTEILTTLLALAADEPWVESVMRLQVLTHHGYGVIALERYRDVLDHFIATLAEAAQGEWRPDHAQAWGKQADRLFAMIERFY